MRCRMPAEWTRHEATWLSWPHNRETWPEGLEDAEAALAEGALALAGAETVRINTLDPGRVERRLRGAPPGRVVLEPIPTDDAWIRDHGAIVVHDETGRRVALDFRYNAWGGKYPPYQQDDAVACRMAARLDLPCMSVDMVLEGGAIDVNGEGRLLTTEQCLLNPNRNPQLDRAAIEAKLARYLGAAQVIWLGEGIAGDDTDGHVDDIARFVAGDTVLAAREPDPADENHAPLAENLRRLRAAGLRVLELPMPPPLTRGPERLPASYANFYVGNEVVLMPAFSCAQDGVAEKMLAACFPGRRIVPIDSRALVIGLGAFHCLTQQVPA
jgi:agmatine deiminase